MRLCALLSTLLAALCLAAAPARSDDPSVDALWREAVRKPEHTIQDHPDFTMIRADETTFYYFTKPGHPAHPGVIKRYLGQREDGRWAIIKQGWSFGSTDANPAFQAWLDQFVESGQRR